jgi:hypothetical protein
MSKLVDPELVERFTARALSAGPEIAAAFDPHAIASAVNDEVRHGKAGTVRNANAVFVHRADLCLRELADLARSRARQRETDLTRYADLWVQLLDTAATAQPSPGALSVALRFWRDHGYPKLNSLIADQLATLGERWPSQGLPDAAPREMTKPRRRTRAPREGKHARANTLPQ